MATKRSSKSGSPASTEGQNNTVPGKEKRRTPAVAPRAADQPSATRSRRAKPRIDEVSVAVPPRTEEVPVAAPSTPLAIEPGISERERIALLAYSFWEARGRQGGSPEEDWFRAEREVRNGPRVNIQQ